MTTAYWDDQYTDPPMVAHHSNQNQQITEDLLNTIRLDPIMDEAFRSAHTVLEIGCGTGELAARVSASYGPRMLYATDLSRAAVNTAQQRFPEVRFWVWDVLKDTFDRTFDLAMSSNTLEHFRDPHAVIDKVLTYSRQFLVVVPYRQPCTDGYEAEGGPGHVSTFTKSTFSRYRVRASAVFETKGWQHRSGDETPLQLAVLLKAKRR